MSVDWITDNKTISSVWPRWILSWRELLGQKSDGYILLSAIFVLISRKTCWIIRCPFSLRNSNWSENFPCLLPRVVENSLFVPVCFHDRGPWTKRSFHQGKPHVRRGKIRFKAFPSCMTEHKAWMRWQGWYQMAVLMLTDRFKERKQATCTFLQERVWERVFCFYGNVSESLSSV